MSPESSRGAWRLAGVAAIAAITLWACVLAGCSEKRASAPAEMHSYAMQPAVPTGAVGGAIVDGPEARDASGGVARASAAMTPQALPDASRAEIIYTGEMTIELDNVGKAVERVTRMARVAGGWVSATTHTSPGEGVAETRLTLRVPAPRFAAVHDSLAMLGDVVLESTRSQDVGREFVDLEARLANSKREEEVIAALFKREGKIGDVLQVERELARVRGEIEQCEGQLRFLKDQVAFSTLSLRLMSRRPEIERKVAGWHLGFHVLRAWHMLVAVARALTYAAIYGAIVLGPLGLLAFVVLRILAARRRP